MLGWKLVYQIGITAQVCASGQWRLNRLVWTTQQCLPLSKRSGSRYLTQRWRDWPAAAGPRAARVSEPRASSLSLLSQNLRLIFFPPSVFFKHAGSIEGIFRWVAAFLKIIRVGWSRLLPYLGGWSWVMDGLYSLSSDRSSCITPEVLCATIYRSCWDYCI